MESGFSEFSYGYALTQEISSGKFGTLTAAPVFLSLRQEGHTGGGYDVKVPLHGMPIFLQFKLSHYLWRTNALEYSEFGGPYYRMYLRSLRHSDQHLLLTDLENSGKVVYYVAPRFHTVEELNTAYTAGDVLIKTAFFRPSDIGQIYDYDSHYITFSRSGSTWSFHSDKPQEKGRLITGKEIIEIITTRVKIQSTRIDDNFFNKISENLVEILDKKAKETGTLKTFQSQLNSQKERSVEKASFAAYLTRVFFDAELFIVGESID